MDLNFLLTSFWQNLHLQSVKTDVNPAAILFPENKKHMVLKCGHDPMVLEEAAEFNMAPSECLYVLTSD